MSNDILTQLQHSGSAVAKRWLVVKALLDSVDVALAEAATAAAVPHWFNPEILTALLEIDPESCERLYAGLQTLSVTERFGDLGYTLHDLTRSSIIFHLWAHEPTFFRTYSARAYSFFSRDAGPQSGVEAIYHSLASGAPDALSVLRQRDFILRSGLNYAAANTLIRNCSELAVLGIIDKSIIAALEEQRRSLKTSDELKKVVEKIPAVKGTPTGPSVVFVSYSPEDRKWLERLKTHIRPLIREGIVELWYDTDNVAGSDLQEGIKEAIDCAKIAILLVSADFMASSFIAERQIPAILDNNKAKGTKIVVICISRSALFERLDLSRIQAINSLQEALIALDTDKQVEIFARAAEEIRLSVEGGKDPRISGSAPLRPNRRLVNFSRLPRPVTGQLAGRADDLYQLDAAFGKAEVRIAGIIADGGVGKTALIFEWLRLLSSRSGNRPRIFAWSFYDPEDPTSVCDSAEFLREAARFFGYSGDWPTTPADKARAVFDGFCEQPTVLVLDGLEPLQYRANVPLFKKGELQDTGVRKFLRSIIVENWGSQDWWRDRLIVLSSREPMTDLEGPSAYQEIALGNLPPEEGLELLKRLGVKGSPGQLKKASSDMQGYVLALVLFGKILVEQFGGDIEAGYLRSLIIGAEFRDPKFFDEPQHGEYARRIMRYYYDMWQEGSPEHVALQMMSLFNRPMGLPEWELLRKQAQFAESVRTLMWDDWREIHDRLESYGLLPRARGSLPEREEANSLRWDCHPLIREYFGSKFRETNPVEWRQAHNLLFDHFQRLPAKEQPDNLDELLPLYRAINHGCLAGEHQAALTVYKNRIMRHAKEPYSTHLLGATAQDLAALSCFLDETVNTANEVCHPLSEKEHAWVQGRSAYCLMCLGRLTEAMDMRQRELDFLVRVEDWGEAIESVISLSNLLIERGSLVRAEEEAEKSRSWAYGYQYTSQEESILLKRRNALVQLATVRHLRGDLRNAEGHFKEAEALQHEAEPRRHRLYSERGWRRNLFLLDRARTERDYHDVVERADTAIDFDKRDATTPWLLVVGLHYLVKVRALLGQGDKGAAQWNLNQSIDFLEKSGTVIRLFDAYMTRATLRRSEGDREGAFVDAREAGKIASKCGMIAHNADALLLLAHLHLDQARSGDNLRAAGEAFDKANSIVQKHGYFLRLAEVHMLCARLYFYQVYQDLAEKELESAGARIQDTGHWGLLTDWHRIKAEIGYQGPCAPADA